MINLIGYPIYNIGQILVLRMGNTKLKPLPAITLHLRELLMNVTQ